jgi:hypothetical protein
MNPVVVTDTMSAGLSYVSGSAAPPPTLQNGQQLIWADATAGAGLAPGGTLQLTFLAQVTTTIGLYDNVVVVEAVHPGGTITDTDSAPVGVDDPAVEVSKRVNAPGAVNGLITFTIDITNTGPSVLDVLPLFDTFSGPVEYVGGTPQANIVDNTNQAIAWNDLTGPAPNGFGQNLAPGQSVTILTIFRITTGAAEFSMVNQAAVSNAIDEFNNPANDDDDTAALTNVPTAVDLLYFNAEWQSNAVRLTWATAVEIDNFGFRLLRSSTGNLADAAEIAFIPGAGHGLQNGQTYAYDDAAAQPGQSYTYWLVDVDLNGIETVHGPASVAAINTGGGNFNFKLYVPFVSR